MKRLKNPSIEDLWNECHIIPISGCWIFLRSPNSYGYSRFSSNGVEHLAHRYIWEKANKSSIPIGMYVCHTCDIPCCINPNHLFVGTPRENYIDMVKKGRAPDGATPKSGRFKIGNKLTPDHRGSNHPNAKLTNDCIVKIRSSFEDNSVLAFRFGVTKRYIERIKKKDVWKHI